MRVLSLSDAVSRSPRYAGLLVVSIVARSYIASQSGFSASMALYLVADVIPGTVNLAGACSPSYQSVGSRLYQASSRLF